MERMLDYPADAVCRKLGINRAQLNSMFASEGIATESGHPVTWVGTEVAADICRRFNLDPQLPMGDQLAGLGILTEPEGRYLDDVE